MIRLYRGPAPEVLTGNQERWTERWQRIHRQEQSGKWATPAARKALLPSLDRMSFGKCAYCEGRLGEQSLACIEHYVAKTIDTSIAFAWSNLFLLCSACNGTKLDQVHGNALLKPDEVDPEPYFWLSPEGELQPHPTLSADAVEQAKLTIKLCGLNRPGLCKGRFELMQDIADFLLSTDPAPEDVRGMRVRLEPTYPYKFVVRSVLRENGYSHLADEDRRRCAPQP